MITKIIVLSILIGVYGLGIWALISTSKDAQKLHAEIDELEDRAEYATKLEELQPIWDDMRELNKRCFGPEFSRRITVIAAVLRTKYKMLSDVVEK